jgi:hypothetical protein
MSAEKIPFDIIATKNKARENFEKSMENTNKLWQDVLRLIITLSSSFLLLTIALVDKLFPLQTAQSLSIYLIVGWILLFVSIIFGIIATLNEIIFISNGANIWIDVMKNCNIKLSEAKTEDTYDIENDKDNYRRFNTIGWGATSINAFILAIIFICIALLEKFISQSMCSLILGTGSLFLLIVTVYLINKREK